MKKLTSELVFGIIELLVVVATEAKKAYTKGRSANGENSTENQNTK